MALSIPCKGLAVVLAVLRSTECGRAVAPSELLAEVNKATLLGICVLFWVESFLLKAVCFLRVACHVHLKASAMKASQRSFCFCTALHKPERPVGGTEPETRNKRRLFPKLETKPSSGAAASTLSR